MVEVLVREGLLTPKVWSLLIGVQNLTNPKAGSKSDIGDHIEAGSAGWRFALLYLAELRELALVVCEHDRPGSGLRRRRLRAAEAG